MDLHGYAQFLKVFRGYRKTARSAPCIGFRRVDARFGMGEESGWRGWLYAVLIKKHSHVQAASWVAALWMLWHLPAFAFNESYQKMGWGVIGWVISLFYGSVLLGWLFLKSGSVIPLIIWHGVFDLITASDHLPDLVPAVISGVVIMQGIYLIGKPSW